MTALQMWTLVLVIAMSRITSINDNIVLFIIAFIAICYLLIRKYWRRVYEWFL